MFVRWCELITGAQGCIHRRHDFGVAFEAVASEGRVEELEVQVEMLERRGEKLSPILARAKDTQRIIAELRRVDAAGRRAIPVVISVWTRYSLTKSTLVQEGQVLVRCRRGR